AAWRFMMTPKPVDQESVEKEEREFLEELQQIRGRFPQVEKHLSHHQDDGLEITTKMRDIRALALSDRLSFFKEHRLQNQIVWYMQKARLNAASEQRWFYAIIAADG